jgi:hypothetical protein
MAEIKGKASEVKLFKKEAFKGNDSYNVFLEGDERKFSYLCQGEPKIKVGEEQEFVIEEKTSGSNAWWTIKIKKDPNAFTPWKFNKPDHVYALEWSRRMFNSSYNTDKPWEVSQLTAIADWLLGQLKKGVSKDALETAVTIQCASAMGKHPIDTKTLSQHMVLFQDWISKNQ